MQHAVSSIITPSAALVLANTERLLIGIPDIRAARFSSPAEKSIVSNHPAFVIGHLSLYSGRGMDLIGKPRGVTERPAGWEDLFKAGVECRDDPMGTIYPPLHELTEHYFKGYRAFIEAINATPDDVFYKPNPSGGRMAELFPTVGALISFLIGAHPMLHLGQLSAWRRMEGMPPAV
ncbi:DinB family protein [soil metagenome]